MDTEVRKRRSRTRIQPLGERVDLTKRDDRAFAALDRHGPLPTPVLFEFWRGDQSGDYSWFHKRMTKLSNELVDGIPFIGRPSELNPVNGSKSEPVWYDLSAVSRTVLAEKGLLSRHYPPRRDKMHHRAMGASVGASIELGLRPLGIRYISGEEMLAHGNCPEATRSAKNPLRVQLSSGKLEPDAIFGLEYPDRGGFRFFAREDDRGTESFARADEMQTSLKEKLDKYIELIRTAGYQRWLGISSFRVMFVTTQPGRIATIRNYLKGHPYADLFLLKSVHPEKPEDASFGVEWRAPRAALTRVLESWQTGAEPFDLTRP